jgi:2,3-bisphosphoglycerate-independent phosphoglycerate mutase
MKPIRPVALIILDGWGIREREHANAVVQAATPNFDHWTRRYERAIVDASGGAVGLPDGQMGNSEVGHLNLGAGRIVYQDITRIDKAIAEGKLGQIQVLADALNQAASKGRSLHLVGLLGPGGVHSHRRHLYALLDLAARHDVAPILHLITDGRDTPPRSAAEFLRHLQARLDANGSGVIGSVAGRYYTMDRDKRWPRTQRGYDAIVSGLGPSFSSAADLVQNGYQHGVSDEFLVPGVVTSERVTTVRDGDIVLFYNFRADRMRQIVQAFADPAFDGFSRTYMPRLTLLTMTEYAPQLQVQVIFPNQEISKPLAEVLSDAGLSQLHAAETEKYAHVTYFFNGGQETPFAGEERILIPSPKVATYDLQPEMSALQLTSTVEARLGGEDDDFVLVNFANPDMVGHTGVLEAAVKAVETVDSCAGRIVDAVLAKGGAAIVTADHGNCEIMVDERSGDPHTYHTTQPVPLFVIKDGYTWLRPRGILADVAPTILHLLGVAQPSVMSGRSLIE